MTEKKTVSWTGRSARSGPGRGRLRSEKATRDRYTIRGYVSTAAKHGIAVFTAIRDTLTGNPWMPPASA